MTRKQERDLAFKLLYQMMIQKESPLHILEIAYEQYDVRDKTRTYLATIVEGVAANQQEIDQLIGEYSHGWSLARIGRVPLAALRLSIFEMLYCEEIPDTVCINEAVALTKLYAEEESAGFVNGVLASVFKKKQSQAED